MPVSETAKRELYHAVLRHDKKVKGLQSSMESIDEPFRMVDEIVEIVEEYTR
jgi:hypothetical protein